MIKILKNQYTIEELINDKNFEKLNSDFSLKFDNKNITLFPKFLEKIAKQKKEKLFVNLLCNNSLNFKEDKEENILFIIKNIFDSRQYNIFSDIYDSSELRKFSLLFKNDNYYIDEILTTSINHGRNDIFFKFYTDDYLFLSDINYLLKTVILNNNFVIFDFLMNKTDLSNVRNINNSHLLNNPSNVYFIKKVFDKYSYSKDDIMYLLGCSFFNFPIFKFLFTFIEKDITKGALCLLIEKSIRNHCFLITEFLFNNVNFNIKDFGFDFFEDFFKSYDNTGDLFDVFFDEDNSMENELKIKFFNVLMSNPYNFNIEKNLGYIIEKTLVKFDLDLIKFLFENYQLEDYIKNNKVKIHEWFFEGILQRSLFFSLENTSYVINKFNINLSYDNNKYIYHLLLQKFNKVGSNYQLLDKKIDNDLNKIFVFFLSDNDVIDNLDINIIERYKDRFSEHSYNIIKKCFSINKF